MPPKSEMQMLKVARQGGPSSQGYKREQGAAMAARSRGDTYIILVIVLIVGQFHNTIGTLKVNTNCTLSSAASLCLLAAQGL